MDWGFGAMGISRKIQLFIGAAFALLGAAPALANSTMDALVDGKALRIQQEGETDIVVIFTANGRYSTSAGDHGAWTLEDTLLCFTRDTNSNREGRGGQRSCGDLPEGKTFGSSWTMPSTEGGSVTLTIITRPEE